MSYIAFAALFFNMFFGHLFPGYVGTATLAGGLFLLLIRLLVELSKTKLKIEGPGILWLAFALMVFVSHVAAVGRPIEAVLVLIAMVGLTLVANVSVAWIRPAWTILLAYATIHALATILSYVAPSVHESIKARWFPDNLSNIDYTAGIAANYTHNGMFCAIAFFGAVALVVGLKRGASRRVMILVALVGFVALVLTTKRAHLLFAIVAFVVAIASSNIRGRFFKIAIGALVAVVAVFLGARFFPGLELALDRIFRTFETSNAVEATSGRTFVWDYAIAGWLENPLFGKGWATFHFVWPNGSLVSIHSHNAILNALYEVGVVGAIFIVLATLITLIATFRLISKIPADAGPMIHGAAYFSLMIQVFMLLHGYTSEEMFRNPYSFTTYFFGVALMLAVRRYSASVSNLETKSTALIKASKA